MKSKSYEVQSNYNRIYYRTVTKIERDLKRRISKAKDEFSQRESDHINYQFEWVKFIGEYDYNLNAVFKEDLLTSNLNDRVKRINKEIKMINMGLSKEDRLPLQPLRARSKKSLENYAIKYFRFLHQKKIIDRVIYVMEQDKKKIWHIHALINCIGYSSLLAKYWLLSDDVYLKPIDDLHGSLVYMSKSFSSLNFKKVKNLENYGFIGNFTKKINPLLQLNNNVKDMKNKITQEMRAEITAFKIKNNLQVIVNELFLKNQERINSKFDAVAC